MKPTITLCSHCGHWMRVHEGDGICVHPKGLDPVKLPTDGCERGWPRLTNNPGRPT